MSNVIDRKVVEMDFDNANFERNAKTSLSTIDKLKAALDFKGSANSLSELSKSAQHFNMFNVENSAEAVKNRFSAMEIIGVGALMRIGQQAVDTGEKLIKSMSTDQIMAGWDKFAKKTTSTATLLGQGFNMDEVTEQLERLNWFTDETSYNFTDMVDSIGKFTASGKGLTESVDAMQGIANWAALSGQNATTASRAMYQLSQAMGAGVMRKEDYKSIQNAAMDTDEFRQKALDAAVALGTLKKNADGSYQSLVATGKGAESFTKSQFTEKLTEGLWFTDKVMMQVFNDYSKGLGDIKSFIDGLSKDESLLTSEVIKAKEAFDKGEASFEAYAKTLDLSGPSIEKLRELVKGLDDFGIKAFGAAQKARTFEDAIDSVKDAASTTWMNIFELFIGNAEEATEVWTDLANYLYDVFVEPLNKLYDFFDDLLNGVEGNRDRFIDIFRNIAGVFESITKPIKQAFSEIFPADENRAANFKGFLDNLNGILKGLKLNELQSIQLKNAFKGLFSVIKFGINAIKTIVTAMKPLITFAGILFNNLLHIASILGAILTGKFANVDVFEKINGAVEVLVGNLLDLIDAFRSTFASLKRDILDGENKLAAFLYFINDVCLDTVYAVTATIAELVKEITGIDISKITDYIDDIAYFVYEALFQSMSLIFNGEGIGEIISTLLNELKWLGIYIIGIFEDLTGIDLSKLKDNFKKLFDSIIEGVDDLSISFSVIDFIPDILDRIKEGLKKVKLFFDPLAEAVRDFVVGILGKIKDNPFLSITTALNAKVFLDIAKAIFGTIQAIPELVKSFKDIQENVCDTLDAVKDTLKALQEQVKSKLIMSIAIAVGILTVSLLLLSTIDAKEISGTIKLFSTALGELVIAFGILEGISSKLGSSGVGKLAIPILAIAASVFILAQALKKIGESGNTFEEVAENLIAMFFIFGYLIAAIALLDMMDLSAKSIGKLILIGIFAQLLGNAIKILAEAMAIIGTIDTGKFMSTWLTLTGAIADMILSIWALEGTNPEGLIKVAISMMLIAAAVKILASAINDLAATDPIGMAQAFSVVGLSIGALVKSMEALNNKNVLLQTALSLIAIAIAVKILTDTIIKLSSYDGKDLAKGFILMAGAMAVVAIISNLLQSSLLKAGIGLIFVAIALKKMANLMIELGQENTEELAWGLLALTGALLLLAAATKLLESNISGAASMLIIAAGLYIMAEAMKKMEEINLGELLADLILVIASMTALTILAAVAQEFIMGAVALIAISAAFTIFAAGCLLLAQADPVKLLENLVIAIVGFAAVIAILVVATSVLTALAGTIMIGAAVFLAASLMFGLGLTIISAGVALISISANLFAMTAASLSEAVIMVADAFRGNIAVLLEGAAALGVLGGVLLIAGIGSAVMAIAGAALTVVILAAAVALAALSGAVALLNSVLESFGESAKTAGESLKDFSESMVKSAPGLVAGALAVEAMVPTLKSITKANKSFAAGASDAAEGLIMMSNALSSMTVSITSFNEASVQLEAELKKLSVTLASMSVQISVALTASQKILNSAIPTFQTIGSNLVLGFVKGILAKTAIAVLTATALGRACANALKRSLQIHSPSRVTDEIAGYFMEGFTNRLDDTKSVEDSAENMGDAAIKSLNAAMSSAYDNLDSDISDPVIKPVMDLSEIQNGSKSLDAMVSRDRATSVMANYRTQRSYEEEEAANNANLLTNLNNKLLGAMTVNNENDTPFNINVVLEGNAGEIFRLVRVENDRFVKSAGYSPLLR